MTRSALVAILVTLLCSAPASAEIINLGNGLIYDSLQNLTWFQDAAYARTSGYDADGKLALADAVAWAASLEYGGMSDWRLPQWLGLSSQRSDTSELSKLFEQLGWVSNQWEYTDTSGYSTGPFVNALTSQVDRYWLAQANNIAWHEVTVFDHEDRGVETPLGAWAVREGSPVARVTEPSTLLLLGVGVFAVARGRRYLANIR